jgi:hypothetical protein
VQQESEFFDLDKSDFGLAPVQVDRGGRGSSSSTSIPTTRPPSASTWDDLGAGIEGYPFDKMTQVYKYRAESAATGSCSSTPSPSSTTHRSCTRSRRPRRSRASCRLRLRGPGLRRRRTPRHGVVMGRHVAAQGPRHGQADRASAAQRPVRALGPPRHRRPRPCPRLNPARHPAWGEDSFVFFPNFMLLIWARAGT